jgi:hypothetical protein
MVKSKAATLLDSVLVLSLVVACAPAAPTPTTAPEATATPSEVLATLPEHLEGLWFDGQLRHYVRFDSGGTVRAAAKPEDLDEESSYAMTYWFEDGLFYVERRSAWEGVGVYKAYLQIQDGRALVLRWECIKDTELERRRVYAVPLVRAD